MKKYILIGLLSMAGIGLPFYVSAQFTVPESEYATITSPARGAVVNLGSTYEITWTPANATSNISIMVGGEIGAKLIVGYIAKNIPNTGKYTWVVNENLLPYDNFFGEEDIGIEITSKLVAGEYEIILINEQDLIGYSSTFKITRPNVPLPTVELKANDKTGTLDLNLGTPVTLSWTSTNATTCEGFTYSTNFKTSDGLEWNKLILPANGTKGLTLTTTTAYSITPRIYCYNSYGDAASSYVYIYFNTPKPPPPPFPPPAPFPTPPPPPIYSMKVTSPASNEKIGMGSSYTIRWTGGDPNKTVNILVYGFNEQYKNGFGSTISTVPNTGSYVWNTNNALTPISTDNTGVRNIAPGSYYLVLYQDTPSGYYSSGYFTVYSTNTAVKMPIGSFDKIENGLLSGWALDPDNPRTYVTIHFYINGPVGRGELAAMSPALIRREDVNKATGYIGNYGFTTSLSDYYKDGKPHLVYAYAVDQNDTTKSTLLPGSPKTYLFLAKPKDWKDGSLFLDSGTIYVISEGKKWGFADINAFHSLGYKIANVRAADLSDIPSGGVVDSGNRRHLRGSLVNINGTIYFMGTDTRYPYPSAEVFLSWGNKFEEILPGNSFDMAVLEGPVAEKYVPSNNSAQRDSRRLADVKQIMTALELYYNDNGMYPPARGSGMNTHPDRTAGAVPFDTYLNPYPVYPFPTNDGICQVGLDYTYTQLNNGQNYNLTFCLGAASGGFAAGMHSASAAGIQ